MVPAPIRYLICKLRDTGVDCKPLLLSRWLTRELTTELERSGLLNFPVVPPVLLANLKLIEHILLGQPLPDQIESHRFDQFSAQIDGLISNI